MQRLTVILLFALLSSSVAQVNILQSSTSTTITSPAGQSSILSTVFNTNPGAVLGTGINWIQSSVTGPGTKTFESPFYASCTGAATLNITAYSTFTAYLDGIVIGSGSNVNKIYTFPLNLSCGSHILKVIVTSYDKTPTLIFIVNQDQSNCYNCQFTGFWNQMTCKCQCINTQTSCGCTSPQVWKDYPTCGCGCANIYTFANVAAIDVAATTVTGAATNTAASASAAIFRRCIAPRYYNQNTCNCVCHYQYCGPRQYWNEDTCSCWDYIY